MPSPSARGWRPRMRSSRWSHLAGSSSHPSRHTTALPRSFATKHPWDELSCGRWTSPISMLWRRRWAAQTWRGSSLPVTRCWMLSTSQLLPTLARSNQALLAVDNTLATPLLQRPFELGADFVVHSATKFLGGHSDLVLGIAVASRSAHFERLATIVTGQGAIPGTLESFLRCGVFAPSPFGWRGRSQLHRNWRATRTASRGCHCSVSRAAVTPAA